MNNIDPSELNIINYLFGEMSEEEKRKFEKELETNKELKAKLEELKHVQADLGTWSNEDIEIPEFHPAASHSSLSASGKGEPSLKAKMVKMISNSWMKYAAVFLGLLVFLQFTGLQISQQGNALMLSFGAPQTGELNSQDVDAIVTHAIAKYAQSQQNDFVSFKQEVNSNFDAINTAFLNLTEENQQNVGKLQNIFDNNLDQQYVSLQTMINEIEDNQRQELEDSFTGIVEFIENNRQKDQFKIQNAFSELATAINNQQYQTNALLTSISTEDTSLKSY